MSLCRRWVGRGSARASGANGVEGSAGGEVAPNSLGLSAPQQKIAVVLLCGPASSDPDGGQRFDVAMQVFEHLECLAHAVGRFAQVALGHRRHDVTVGSVVRAGPWNIVAGDLPMLVETDWQVSILGHMLRPGNWTRPAGGSPVRVIAGEPGSRPRFVVERRRAERGVESLFGGSKRAGRSATRRESCSLVIVTTGEPSRSCHGEGLCPTVWPVPEMPLVGSPRGRGSGTYARSGSGQERPVWSALSAKTLGISRW